MKGLIKILIVFYILTSCSVTRFNDVTGLYRTKGGFEWGSSIQLDKDSTFDYKWQSGLNLGQTKGKWTIKGNSLILNSDYQPKFDTTPDFKILEFRNTKSDFILLDLLYQDSIKLAGALGFLFYHRDTIDGKSSDINGLIKFKKQNYDSLKVYFIGLRKILIKPTNNDYLKIMAFDNKRDYEVFTNERWKINNDFLVDRTKNQYYYEKIFYKVKK